MGPEPSAFGQTWKHERRCRSLRLQSMRQHCPHDAVVGIGSQGGTPWVTRIASILATTTTTLPSISTLAVFKHGIFDVFHSRGHLLDETTCRIEECLSTSSMRWQRLEIAQMQICQRPAEANLSHEGAPDRR